MKTSSITKGAMCVAIYGLLLLLNQQTGLMIEASLSWVFIMPILLYSASQGVRAGLVTGISMGLLSFLFGSFTTWFYSWSALLIGYLYGVGVHQQFRHRTNFFLCFLLLNRKALEKIGLILKVNFSYSLKISALLR